MDKQKALQFLFLFTDKAQRAGALTLEEAGIALQAMQVLKTPDKKEENAIREISKK